MLYAIKVLNPGSVPVLGDESYVKSSFGDTSRLDVARTFVKKSYAERFIENLNDQSVDRDVEDWYEGEYTLPAYKVVEVVIREESDEELKQSGQLPESMEHCTILFKQCPKGHGWLTATNWVQHPCQQCIVEELKDEIDVANRNSS